MGLSGKRTKEIVEAIKSAFINRNELVMMLDCELNMSAADLLDNSTHDVTIYNLVKKLDSQDRIKELIEGARRGNPGNPDLISVQKKLYHPLSEFFYEKMIPILESIDFEICKKICYEILPSDAHIHLDNFRNFRDINSLEKLFFVDYPAESIMLNFANLLANALKEDSVRQELEKEVKNVAQQHNVSFSTLKQISILKDGRDNKILPYLLIIIDAECMIKGYLYYKRLNDNEWEIDPIDINHSQKGEKVTFDELKTTVELFIRESEEILFRKTKEDEDYDLTIEFFLPLNYLYKKIEQWTILDPYSDSKFLGKEYIVVVRSYERLIELQFIKSLKAGIGRLNQLRKELNYQIIKDAFEHWDELNDCNCDELEEQLREKIGLKLICPESISDKKREAIFKAIIRSGIPITIWTRTNNISEVNLKDELEKIITSESLADCNILFQNVWKKRKEAYVKQQREQLLGYHLGILFEEPVLDKNFLQTIRSYLKSAT